jgi:hypothetical protein
MSDNDMKPMSDLEKQVEDEIENARNELTTVILAKQQEVIERMGKALEKIRDGEKRSSICEELKVRLREEIKRKLISEKTIEAHSKPEWKNPAKSKAGKKGAEAKNKAAESAEISAAESAQQDAILVRTDGSGEGESAAESAAELEHDKEEEAEQVPLPQGPTGDTLLRANGSQERQAHESDDDSDIDWRHRHEQEHAPGDERLRKLEEELKQEKEQKLALVEHNDYLQAQLQAQHKDRDALGQLKVDFEFYLLLREVRPYMVERFKVDKDIAKVWFHGTIDPRTGSVVRASCGRKEAGDDGQAGA